MCGLSNRFLFLTFVAAASVTLVSSTKYRIVYENLLLSSPCEEYPNNYIDVFLDISNATSELIDDGQVHVWGTLKLIYKLLDEKLYFDAQVFKKKGSQWVSTIYNMKRTDFCRSLFDPSEIWYKYLTIVPVEERKCPLKVGLIIPIDLVFNTVIELPSNSLEGDYRATVKLYYPKHPERFVCFNILAFVEKL